MTTLIVNVHVC